MTHHRNVTFIAAFTAISVLIGATPAWATQTHGEPEGLYVHQAAHLFFIFAMGLLIYWLRQRHLVREKAWRYIQYGAMLFTLWNIDTFTVHFLDEQVDLIRTNKLDTWHMRVETAEGHTYLGLIYYLAKMDHLLCVPALLFLYLGLKRLHDKTPSQSKGAPTP